MGSIHHREKIIDQRLYVEGKNSLFLLFILEKKKASLSIKYLSKVFLPNFVSFFWSKIEICEDKNHRRSCPKERLDNLISFFFNFSTCI